MAFPIIKIVRPAVLVGQKNGLLDLDVLTRIEGGTSPDIWLVEPAARAWKAMAAAAKVVGVTLASTSQADSYRPYAVQNAIFSQRYSRTPVSGYIATRTCGGVRYYQKPKTAMAACPGTSNHGWALAVDVANASGFRLDWLEKNAPRFGWSWETLSEMWHIRYTLGNRIPAAVLAFEEDDMDAAQFLALLKDPRVAAELRRLPWQYDDDAAGPAPSAHGILLSSTGELRSALKKVGQSVPLTDAQVAVIAAAVAEKIAITPEQVREIVRAELDATRPSGAD